MTGTSGDSSLSVGVPRTPRRFLLAMAILYPIVIASVGLGLWRARAVVIEEYNDPEVLAGWKKWQVETERQAMRPEGPERHVVGGEPPGLVMMRDKFPYVVLGTVLTVSFLFAFFAFVIYGMLPGKDGAAAGPLPDDPAIR